MSSLLSAYVECALWSSTDEDGEALDAVYTVDDLAPEALASMQAECEDFVALLEQESIDWSDWSDEQLGHDFWLTRNGHGAGFWDRGYALGDRLTALCKPYGSSDLYVDEDGSVYVT